MMLRRHPRNDSRKAGDRRSPGQGLVEFALVLPIFLLIVFGIIDVGRYIYITNAFNQAAREAARYGSVEQWSYNCPASVVTQTRFSCTAAVALGRIAGAPAFVKTPPDVTCLKIGGDPSSAVVASACRAGYLLQVTVATPTSPANQKFQFFTPVIGQILGSPTISGQASVVVQ
jgi:Flp pilus assembly protein TadG